MVRFDLSDQRAWAQADLHRSFVEPVNELRERYDLIVFRLPTPPFAHVLHRPVCQRLRHRPLGIRRLGTQGIMQVTAAIDYVRSRFNQRLQLLGYLVSRFKRRRAYQQSYLSQLRAHFGPMPFDTVIPDLAQFERSVTDAVLLTEHAATSPAGDIPCNQHRSRRAASAVKFSARPAARINQRSKFSTVSTHVSADSRSRDRIGANSPGIVPR